MRVSNQTRVGLIVFATLLILVCGELAFEWWRGSEAVVSVENAGTAPIEGFVLLHGKSKSSIPLIAPGASVRIYISSNENSPLSFTVAQEGNPLNACELPDFSPAQLEREGLMLNVRILPNGEIERFGDVNDNVGPPLTRRYRALRSWVANFFAIPSF